MSESQNFRMAALKLHGLHPRDRAWMLDRFAPQQQSVLRALIKELDELGLVSTEKLANDCAAYPVGNFPLDPALVLSINLMPPELVLKTFAQMPDRLKAMLLHAAHWHWSSAVWLKLEQQERARLTRHMNQLEPVKPAVFTAMVECFAEESGRYDRSMMVDA